MEKELLQFCRYYKGEKDCPYKDTSNSSLGWNIEMMWVKVHSTNPDVLQKSLSEYIGKGLASFRNTDDTPMSFKAFFLNKYLEEREHDSIQDFKNFYLRLYP